MYKKYVVFMTIVNNTTVS